MLDIIDSNVNTEERKKALELDDDRRRYVHYFIRNKNILKNFPDDFVKDTIYPGEVKLLLIIEPMEKVKAQHSEVKFVSEMFDKFRERYKEELKKQ